MSYPDELSYPPDRYHGDTGEVSATFRPVSAPAEITYTRRSPSPSSSCTAQGLIGGRLRGRVHTTPLT